MKFKKLSEIVSELESGSRPKGGVSVDSGTIPSLGAEHLDDNGRFNFHKKKYITETFFNSLKTGIVKRNDILIVKDGATTGKTSFVDENFPYAKAAINEHVFRVCINRDKAYPKYVFFFLKTLYGQMQIKKDFRGATVGGISRKFVNLAKIPIPEKYEDQIRIATLLSHVEDLIAKRKESILLLDELLKSTFLEMFGDHDKIKLEKYKFDDLKVNQNGTFSNGPFGSDLLTSELTDSGVPVIYIRDIRTGCFYWISNVYVSEEKANSLPNCVVMPGDLLIAKVGDPPGVAAIFPKKLSRSIITQDVIRIRLNKKIATPEYLKFYLNSILGKRLIKRITIKGTRSRFPLNKLKQLQIQIPDLNLQNQFAQFVQKTELLKTKCQSSLHEIENLYGSISQRAFRGELDLSKIPIHHEVVVHETLHIHDEPTIIARHIEKYELTIDGLKVLIQEKLPEKFTFKMLINVIEDHVAEENQNFDNIKALLTDLLQGKKPLLNQEFGHVETNETRNKVQNQIFFCVNK
jgi:type I restriction enzyme, S subunit